MVNVLWSNMVQETGPPGETRLGGATSTVSFDDVGDRTLGPSSGQNRDNGHHERLMLMKLQMKIKPMRQQLCGHLSSNAVYEHTVNVFIFVSDLFSRLHL